jgi:hypothetical protein
VPGLLNVMPLDGLQVGTDLMGVVGDHPVDFVYDGEIKNVRLTIGN